jgi:DEAD/DEAH box helicase domain-containing protein
MGVVAPRRAGKVPWPSTSLVPAPDYTPGMDVDNFLEKLRRRPALRENVRHWITLEAREARHADAPPDLHPEVSATLLERGVRRLYTHQREAIDHVTAGRHVCVATPTASGKTLCYDVPVLDALAKGRASRALYLFPTKALSQDQVTELRDLSSGLSRAVRSGCYDGDTPPAERRALREDADVLVTNPYMLHTGILPNHPKWVSFFRDLRFVVLDEIHTYRGVFGSHMANVLRRLRRIARHYGSEPTFVTCSATIGNPEELATRLLGLPVEVVDESGAPAGKKHLLLYNPPVVHRDLGLRAAAAEEVRRLLRHVDESALQTIVFARTRRTVEVLVKYLRDALVRDARDENRVRAYRGGYLPRLRRSIEEGLREGRVRTVVSTNALELGIDIGGLDLCLQVGYPGSLSSFWQQVGRAGRRSATSAAVLVARSTALDQYLVANPGYLTERPQENVVLDPDNLVILLSQLKCARVRASVPRRGSASAVSRTLRSCWSTSRRSPGSCTGPATRGTGRPRPIPPRASASTGRTSTTSWSSTRRRRRRSRRSTARAPCSSSTRARSTVTRARRT